MIAVDWRDERKVTSPDGGEGREMVFPRVSIVAVAAGVVAVCVWHLGYISRATLTHELRAVSSLH